nr:hypothetical protein [Tanacetum cinerariifolium]
MSDSDESRVTYTEVSSLFKDLSDIGSPRADDHEHLELLRMLEDPYVEPYAKDASPTAQSPEYVPESDLKAHPEEDDDEDPEEDPVDYPADGRDDGDDEDGSSEDDEDDNMDIEADEKEEEEHPAPTDSVVVALPATDQALSAEETEPFETDESAATPLPHPAYRMTARISIPALVPVPAWSDSEVVRLLAMSSPPSSPLSPLSSPSPRIPFPPLPPILSPPSHVLSPAPPPSLIRSLGYRAAMIRLRAEAISTSHSPPLPPPFILSPTRSDAPSSGIPPPLPISAPTTSPPLQLPSARESSSAAAAARPAGGLRVDYGFVATMNREIKHDSEREKKMAPKRTTRVTTDQETTNTTSVINAQLQAMIDQGITAALAARDALISTNGDDSHHSGMGVRRTERATHEFAIATELMDQKIRTFVEREIASKRKFENTSRSTHNQQQQPNKRQNTGRVYNAASSEKKQGTGSGQKPTCYGCGVQGHFKRECPKLRNNNNHGNQGRRDNAPAKVYTVGRVGTDPDANVVMGTFLLNNRYASVLFDTSADKSLVSTAFSTQINITPSTLDHCYDVELADERIIGLNTILRGCTLNLLNHPFNKNLMPVELGSFNAIIGKDWLAKYQAVIVCAEKIVRIPWGNKTLIIHGDDSNQGNTTRLNIISCTKTEKYLMKGFPIFFLMKGFPIFLAHITTKEVEDKSEKKRLEDVPIVQNFPEVECLFQDLPEVGLSSVKGSRGRYPKNSIQNSVASDDLRGALFVIYLIFAHSRFWVCWFNMAYPKYGYSALKVLSGYGVSVSAVFGQSCFIHKNQTVRS